MTGAVSDPVVDLVGRAVSTGLDGEELRPLFERFVTIGMRHAALERAVLGAVPLTFPAHLLSGEPTGDDPLTQGIGLADRERARLGGDPAEIDRLERIIEDQGVKVITLPFPQGSGLLAAFVFHADTGPAVLIDAAASRHERRYAMAHGYGHYLADHDPWHAWTCRTGGGGDSMEELRAHGFSGAFLVPGPALTAYLRAVPAGERRPVSAALIRQLRVYFDADARAILGRLLAEGHIDTSEIAPLMAALADASAPGRPGAPTVSTAHKAGTAHKADTVDTAVDDDADDAPLLPNGLSDRYITLAVMAFRAGQLDHPGLARALETDEETAAAIEARFHREAAAEGTDG